MGKNQLSDDSFFLSWNWQKGLWQTFDFKVFFIILFYFIFLFILFFFNQVLKMQILLSVFDLHTHTHTFALLILLMYKRITKQWD